MTFSNILKSKTLATSLLVCAFIIPTSASAQIFNSPGGNTLLGAGIGAGIGGVLGSNLAGTGVQQEGTAIGAVLGGIAGAAIMNRGVDRRSNRYGGYVPGFGPGYGYEYSRPAPVPYSTFGGRYVNEARYGGGMSGQFIQPPFAQAPFVQAPFVQAMSPQGLQYIQGPSFVQNYTIPHVTQQIYYPPVQQQITRHVYAPAKHITRTIVHHQPTVTRTVHVIRPEPVNIVEHQYAEPAPAPVTHTLPAPSGVYCYAGSNKRYNAQGRLISGKAKPVGLSAYECS